MPWIERHKVRFWVGRHSSLGTIVIPESELEFAKTRNDGVFAAFLLEDMRIAKLNPHVIREKISLIGLSDVDEARIFNVLENNYSRALFDRNCSRGALSLDCKMSLMRENTERTKKILDGGGKVNSCWKCGFALNTKTNELCKTCDWMICVCGACGCHRNRSVWLKGKA